MAIRTSVAEVKALVGSTSLADAMVTGIIARASEWINTNPPGAYAGHAVEDLESMELFLAGAQVSSVAAGITGGILESATRSDISEKYATSGDAKPRHIRFLEIAAAIDKTGSIGERFLGRKRARFSRVRGYAEV